MDVNNDSDNDYNYNTKVMSLEQYSTFCSFAVFDFFASGMYIDPIQWDSSYDL